MELAFINAEAALCQNSLFEILVSKKNVYLFCSPQVKVVLIIRYQGGGMP